MAFHGDLDWDATHDSTNGECVYMESSVRMMDQVNAKG
jgi:hypothetical protein